MDDATRILPGLFLGGAPHSAVDVAALVRRGITAVLTLQTDGDLAAMGLDWRRVAAWYRHAGIEVHRVPIADWSPQAVVEQMGHAVAVLDTVLSSGHTVYLHCTAGVNRSPSVALAYLRLVKGEPLGRALRRITRSRPQASPYPEVLAALRSAASRGT